MLKKDKEDRLFMPEMSARTNQGSKFTQYSPLVISRIVLGETKLFEHQQEALLRMFDKAARGELDPSQRSSNTGAGYLLMGVGTGKSVIIECLPYILGQRMTGRQAIVCVDNCTLRDRIMQDFPTLPVTHVPIYESWPLYNLDILPPGVPPPSLAELKAEQWRSYSFNLEKVDLLVVNRQFLVNLINRGEINPANVGLLIIDEAHHASAASYTTIINYFNSSLLVFLTGSRFRSDSKPIPHIRYTTLEDTSETGQIITRYSPVTDYEFTIQDAWQLKEPPIKRVMYKEATSKAFLVEEENGEEIEYTPSVFFAKAESDREWFRKILLADSFCLPVLEKAVEILTQKRGTGQPHAMIVRALNIPHAHRLYQLLQNFLILKERVGLVHSEKEGFDLAGKPSVSYQRFFSGDYICLVHCGMVGEGFSHPWASVSVSLCIMKSLTVAEQEFGRIVRRVPGRPPGNFPDLTHENWGVVVSHEALGIRDIFQKFLEGQKLAPLSGYGEEEIQVTFKPIIETEYSAGENVIKFNDTSKLKAGDIIVLNLPAPAVNNTRTQNNQKFNLASELKQSGSLTTQIEQKSENQLLTARKSVSDSKGLYNVFKNAADEVLRAIQPYTEKVAEPSLQDKICDAIVERMNQIRNTRTVSIRVEAVLDNRTIQILPQLIDLPAGSEVVKKQISRTKEEVNVNFIGHVGLDWMVMVDGITMPFNEYKRRIVLKQKGFALDDNGDILAGGMRLRDTMPSSTYATFIKELEIDIEYSEVIPPHPTVSCRPDEVKRQNATKYGAAISSSIYKLLDHKWLIPDGSSGKSLIDNPLECLLPLMVRESELEEFNGVVNPDAIARDFYKNNGQMLHKVVFAYIKRQTGKKWGIHESISEYELAVKVAKELLVTVRSELIERQEKY